MNRFVIGGSEFEPCHRAPEIVPLLIRLCLTTCEYPELLIVIVLHIVFNFQLPVRDELEIQYAFLIGVLHSPLSLDHLELDDAVIIAISIGFYDLFADCATYVNAFLDAIWSSPPCFAYFSTNLTGQLAYTSTFLELIFPNCPQAMFVPWLSAKLAEVTLRCDSLHSYLKSSLAHPSPAIAGEIPLPKSATLLALFPVSSPIH
jgi:hypothetical protein